MPKDFDLYNAVCAEYLFSSVSCGRGNADQTNSVMERICEARQEAGVPELAFELRAIGDVSLIMQTKGGNETVDGGTCMASCLSVVYLFLHHYELVLVSIVLSDSRKVESGRSKQVSLIDAVANILGVKDTKNIVESVTGLLGQGLNNGCRNQTDFGEKLQFSLEY